MDKKEKTIFNGINPKTNSTPYNHPKQGVGLARVTLSIGMLVITTVVAACSPAASNLTPLPTLPIASVQQSTAVPTKVFTPPATSVPQQAATPTTAIVPPATSASQQTGTTTQLDPCQLISSQEASTLASASFGTGLEDTTPGGGRICTYGSETTNVFKVEVAQAPDVATAQADKAQFVADLQANLQQLTNGGLNVTEMPNFADGAVMADASINTGAGTINGRAMGFLKGTVFFGFSDLVVGGAAPSSAAVQSEATTVLGNLP